MPSPQTQLGPALVAVGAWIAVLFALRDGPGVTMDEPFNAGHALVMGEQLLSFDLVGLARQTAVLPDHPPLGRLWLGVCAVAAQTAHGIVGSAEGLSDIAAARTGSALAYALTILLVGSVASKWYGRAAGVFAALAVALMPRTFGHAQLAALESGVNLSYTAAVLYCATRWSSGPPGWKSAAIAGVLLGLALLTKIQGIFLPAAIIPWLLWRYRTKAIVPLLIWSAVGVAVLFALWPWLWEDPVGHVLRYLGRSTHRPTILTWYVGEVFKDREVPWDFPWVTFAVSVPLGFQVFGLTGAALRPPSTTNAAHVPAPGLILLAILVPLVAFSTPGVPVYDGERLFAMVFPLWGLFVGRGAGLVWNAFMSRAWRWTARVIVTASAGLAALGIVSLAPCQLSYYSGLVGGLSGAERLGFATTYWGDAFTTDFLNDVAASLPEGATLQVCPVMTDRVQLEAILGSSPGLRERKIRLVPWHTHTSPHVLLFARKEYLDAEFRHPEPTLIRIALRRDGVLLAALLRVR